MRYTANVITEELEDGSFDYKVRLQLNDREVVIGCNTIEDATALRNAMWAYAATIESFREIPS
jgi:hypothetical protein